MSMLPIGAGTQMPGHLPQGMFGAGKPKMDWAGLGQALIGGYMAGRGLPGGNAILGMANQRRQQEAEQAQYGKRREDEFQDWVRKQAYQQANPNPVNNDTVADYNFWKQTLPPEQFNTWLENKINPPQLMNIPGVGVVSVPRQGGGQSGAPAAPGVTFTPIDEGGPAPQGPGGFRPSY
jgi:hypothetical protein